eukprot:3188323-Pyramimonas_sp.AAC.1
MHVALCCFGLLRAKCQTCVGWSLLVSAGLCCALVLLSVDRRLGGGIAIERRPPAGKPFPFVRVVRAGEANCVGAREE